MKTYSLHDKVTCILYFNQLKNDKASGGHNQLTHYYTAYLVLHARTDSLPKLEKKIYKIDKFRIAPAENATFFLPPAEDES